MSVNLFKVSFIILQDSDSITTSDDEVEDVGDNLTEKVLTQLRKTIYSSNLSINIGEDEELSLILDQVIQITDIS